MELGLKMENFNIMLVQWKGGHKKKTICRGKGGFPKKGGVDSLQI